MAGAQKGRGPVDLEDSNRLPSLSQPSSVLEGRGLLQKSELECALAKVGRRVVILFMAIAIMNHLDRSNLAYAALSLNRDNKFNAHIFSVGASLFFVSFCVFQVPANLVMVRVGFRPWLAFLLVGWGIVAVSFMFISSPWSFYLLRLLLGVFESGAFPAMWYALSVFFPRKRITKPFAYLTIGIMIANMLGAPLAAGLLAMEGLGGLKGWQWLFMLEGVPSIILGVLVFLLLPGSISSARFLTPAERDALEAEVAQDHLPGPLAQDLKGAWVLIQGVARNGYMWLASLCGLLASVSSHTYLAFTPIVINNLLQGTALSSASVAASKGEKSLLPVALAMVPYTLATVLSYFVAHNAQRRDEHFWHVSLCLLIAGVVLALFTPLATAAMAAGFVSWSLSLAVGAAANGPAMALVGRLCKGPAEQVVALPMFSSASVLGGIIGPLMTGALLTSLGGFTYVSIIMGVLMALTGVLVLVLRAWVLHDGGLPDGGKRHGSQALGRVSDMDSEMPPGMAPTADEVCVVLSKDAERPEHLLARVPGTPKAGNA